MLFALRFELVALQIRRIVVVEIQIWRKIDQKNNIPSVSQQMGQYANKKGESTCVGCDAGQFSNATVM